LNLPNVGPAQEIVLAHYEKEGHGAFKVYGGGKDKISGVYCKDCKRFITPIVVRNKHGA